MDLPDSELSILLVDDAEIEQLNFNYRNKKKPTNVLSFPMGEDDMNSELPLLGDIVVSVETASREAAGEGITLEERLSQLLIHGLLHLIGYDHEKSEFEEDRMYKKSLKLLRLIEKNDKLDFF